MSHERRSYYFMVCTGMEQSLMNVFRSLNYNEYLVKKLKPLCRNVYDVLVFEDRFNSKQIGREFFDVCKYRKYIQRNEWYSFDEFCHEFFDCPKDALERLSLSEVLDWQIKEFVNRFSQGEFSLFDFYHFYLKNKQFSLYRVLRKFCEF
jgi:hypothetical protein